MNLGEYMRNLRSAFALLVLAVTLTACGGSDDKAFVTPGGSGSSGNGSGSSSPTSTQSTVSTVTVASSASTLPPDGSSSATITVTATNSSNVAVSGATVTFAAGSGGTLTNIISTTNASGQATATLTASGNPAAGTAIKVIATVGSISGYTTVTVASTSLTISLLTSAPQIPSNGSSSATITALVVDANKNVVPNAAVSFTATGGALGEITPGVTGSNGEVTATLNAGAAPQDGPIAVTATVGSSPPATITINVVGTTLTLSGPTSLVQGASGTYAVTLDDSGGNGIGGQTVQVCSASGNKLTNAQGAALPVPTTVSPPCAGTVGTVTTGTNGQASFVLTGTNSGSDTLTATTAYAATPATQAVAVSSQNFTVTAPTANATFNVQQSAPTTQNVTVTWTNNGANVTSGTVNFATSRGTITPTSVAVTAGAASATVYSPTAGPATITATAVTGSGSSATTVASAQVAVNFVAPPATAQSISVQANPSTVALQGQSTIVATVTDGANGAGNPVQGATVNFTLTDSTGGSLSAGSAITNAQGQATVTYTASTVSSTPNGVSIQAAVGNSTTATVQPASTTLTVGGQTVFLSLGSGNQIGVPDNTQFSAPYTVQAVDAAGNGQSGVNITFTVQSVAYATGSYSWGPVPGTTTDAWLQSITAPRSTNDPFYDAIVASITGNAGCTGGYGYQVNSQFQTTAPPSPVPSNWIYTAVPGSAASTSEASIATDSSGTATVNVLYPQSDATWVAVTLTATATVQGTQNSTSTTFWLPGLASDYTTQTPPPPGETSPFGVSTACYYVVNPTN